MATRLRALLMLVILVGGPVAWIYLGPLPVGAQQVVIRLISTAKNSLYTTSANSSELPVKAAPRFDVVTNLKKIRVDNEAEIASFMPDIQPLLEQLQGIGVSEYSLEHWGGQGKLYRFCCSMPIGSSNVLTTLFEGVNEDPRVSIRQVLHEIDAWQRERQSRWAMADY
ncbi:MAG: hypothetical protein ABGX16_03930 [Pirellulales bacterium]